MEGNRGRADVALERYDTAPSTSKKESTKGQKKQNLAYIILSLRLRSIYSVFISFLTSSFISILHTSTFFTFSLLPYPSPSTTTTTLSNKKVSTLHYIQNVQLWKRKGLHSYRLRHQQPGKSRSSIPYYQLRETPQLIESTRVTTGARVTMALAPTPTVLERVMPTTIPTGGLFLHSIKSTVTD